MPLLPPAAVCKVMDKLMNLSHFGQREQGYMRDIDNHLETAMEAIRLGLGLGNHLETAMEAIRPPP